MTSSTTYSAGSDSPSEQDTSPTSLLAEWRSAVDALEECRRRQLAFAALSRSAEKSEALKQLEGAVAASESRAGALRKRLLQQNGFR